MRVYYNEFDRGAAAWLRELIRAGLIPDGDVDERDIREVKADEIRGYQQQHFFCGISGWPLALQLAGWPDSQPVWTGSPPCQGFSSAGKRKGFEDERHLWPEMFRLIRECRPPVVFGEQVSAAIGMGWLDAVHADAESIGYELGSSVLTASVVGAPHIRARIYWVLKNGSTDAIRFTGRDATGEADGRPAEAAGGTAGVVGVSAHDHGGEYPGRDRASENNGKGAEDSAVRVSDSECSGVRAGGRGADGATSRGVQGSDGQRQRLRADAGADGEGEHGRVSDAESPGRRQDAGAVRGGKIEGLREPQGEKRRRASEQARRAGDNGSTVPVRPDRLGNADVSRADVFSEGCAPRGSVGEPGSDVSARGVDDPAGRHRRGNTERGPQPGGPGPTDGNACTVGVAHPDGAGLGELCGGESTRPQLSPAERAGNSDFWNAYRVIPCLDGKHRRIPVEAESFLLGLADGLPDHLAALWHESGIGVHPLTGAKTPGRNALLKGVGNAIVPQLAAEFIRAFLEAESGMNP